MTIQEYLKSNDEQLVRIGFQLLKQSPDYTFHQKYKIMVESGLHVWMQEHDKIHLHYLRPMKGGESVRRSVPIGIIQKNHQKNLQ